MAPAKAMLKYNHFRKKTLTEENHGINFQNFNKSKQEKSQLQKVLKLNMKELNKFVEEGDEPIFGYPPVLYSPLKIN
jgi:hypothetical protein